jgi:hypothetical protein
MKYAGHSGSLLLAYSWHYINSSFIPHMNNPCAHEKLEISFFGNFDYLLQVHLEPLKQTPTQLLIKLAISPKNS